MSLRLDYRTKALLGIKKNLEIKFRGNRSRISFILMLTGRI